MSEHSAYSLQESPEYEVLNNPAQRLMLEVAAVELAETQQREGYGAMIFLDRGARPLQWLGAAVMKEALHANDTPQYYFLRPSPHTPDTELVDRINSVAAIRPPHNDKLAIVDEVEHTGESFRVTKSLASSVAQPAGAEIDRIRMLTDLPAWNGNESLVGVKNAYKPLRFYTEGNPTPQSRGLRTEISTLARAATAHYPIIKQTLDYYHEGLQDEYYLKDMRHLLSSYGVETTEDDRGSIYEGYALDSEKLCEAFESGRVPTEKMLEIFLNLKDLENFHLDSDEWEGYRLVTENVYMQRLCVAIEEALNAATSPD